MTTAASAAPPAPDPTLAPRLGYQPALDGWRGVGIVMVMAYHGGLNDLIPGAFLWIDGFFTLSAFLITTLLLEEQVRAGRIDLVAFWARRVRRLAPALLLALAGMGLFALVAERTQLAALPGDVLAALFYVANWRAIATGSDYFAAFETVSPLKHTWSLAIEEQFYLLFPVVAVAVLALGRRLRTSGETLLAAVAGAGVVASAWWMQSLHASGATISRLYYGTDTRAQSLLAGVVLAVVWRRLSPRVTALGRQVLALVGLVLFTAFLLGQNAIYESSAWLYQGGFLVNSVAQCTVFVALLVPGPLRRGLAWRPVAWVGGLAYGLYLFHFPLFLWLDEGRTGLDGTALLALRFAATFAVAVPVFYALEIPVRTGRWPRRGTLTARIAWPVAVAALTAVALGVHPEPAEPTREDLAALVTTTRPSPTTAPDPGTPSTTAPPPPRLAVVGDSSGDRLAMGVEAWATATGAAVFVGDGSRLGCPVGRGGTMHTAADVVGPVSPQCDWETAAITGTDGQPRPTYPDLAATWNPDLVVAAFGGWEVADRQLPGDDTWRAPGDPVYDAWLLAEMNRAVDALSAQGAHVVWLTSPPWEGATRRPPDRLYEPAADPARMARFNELVQELAAARPDDVTAVDLAGWIASTGEDERLRPDGAHLEPETAVETMNRFLAAELAEVWSAHGG